MKIAVPVVNGELSMHFGHCENFAIVEVYKDSNEIMGMENKQPPPHEPGVLPKWLNEEGVEIIIAGGMGQRAQMLFGNFGIKVIVGAKGGKPEQLVRSYLEDSLTTGSNICDH